MSGRMGVRYGLVDLSLVEMGCRQRSLGWVDCYECKSPDVDLVKRLDRIGSRNCYRELESDVLNCRFVGGSCAVLFLP